MSLTVSYSDLLFQHDEQEMFPGMRKLFPPLRKKNFIRIQTRNVPMRTIYGIQINRLINIERTNRNLKPLTWDDKIGLIAREHSQDMAKRNFFAHDNPEGEDPISHRAPNSSAVPGFPPDGRVLYRD